jgi:uncharacterized protein YigE (DUF2233 family)
MRPLRRVAALILLMLLAGCDLRPAPATPDPALFWATPTQARPPTPIPIPTPTTTPVGAWRAIQPGLEYRELDVMVDQRRDRLRLARVDPQLLRLRVVYNPAQPRRVGDWLAQERALLAVNGGYFDPNNQALGLLIHEGVRSGQAYQGFGGMLAISEAGVRMRWNVSEPYVPGEPLTSALQNFPMLVLPGGAPNTGIDDNLQLAPRTAVGQDRQGRIVFVVSPGAVFTLTGLGQWLAASDLDLDTALNLDGGSSSGLLLRSGPQRMGIDSWVEVPDAIVVETR